MHHQNQELLQILHNCAMECDHCFYACFQEQDVKMMAKCIQLDRDCSEICHLTASAISRNSANKNKYLRLCAEICRACAEECGKHEHDHCKRCAEMCKRCAEACEGAVK